MRPSPAVRPVRRSALKRVLMILGVVFAVAVLALGGAGLYVWQGMRWVPAFYSAAPLEGQERLDAIASMERKFLNFQSAVDASNARESRPPSNAAPEDGPGGGEVIKVNFTPGELDTYLRKWLGDGGYVAALERYLADPRVALADGEIIFAGRSADLGAIVSFHFRPREVEGELQLALHAIYVGRVPVPQGLFANLKRRAAVALEADAAALRDEAALTRRGLANEALATLVTRRQLARLLGSDAVAAPMLFPTLVTGGGQVPTRIVSLVIIPESAEMGLLVLSSEQRQALLDRARDE